MTDTNIEAPEGFIEYKTAIVNLLTRDEEADGYGCSDPAAVEAAVEKAADYIKKSFETDVEVEEAAEGVYSNADYWP